MLESISLAQLETMKLSHSHNIQVQLAMSVSTYVSLPPSQAMFTQGNVVVLQANASGKSLRIHHNGKVEGVGGTGTHG